MPSSATPSDLSATPSAPAQANQALDRLEEGVQRLSERWLPRVDELRDFVGRWEQAWNSHNLDDLEKLVTEDITWEDPAMYGETVHGRAEFRAFTETLFRGLPDVRFDGVGAPYLCLEGSGVALPWRMTGTFTGDLPLWGKRFGPTPPAFAPTGRRVDIEGVDLYEFRDGLICRWVIVYDLFALSQQLGLLPGTENRLLSPVLRVQRLLATRMRRRGGK
jgi:predicted ester cyclase